MKNSIILTLVALGLLGVDATIIVRRVEAQAKAEVPAKAISVRLTMAEASKYCEVEKAKGRECSLVGITIAPSPQEQADQDLQLMKQDIVDLKRKVDAMSSSVKAVGGIPRCPSTMSTTSSTGPCLVWK